MRINTARMKSMKCNIILFGILISSILAGTFVPALAESSSVIFTEDSSTQVPTIDPTSVSVSLKPSSSSSTAIITATVSDTSTPSASLIGMITWSDNGAGGTFTPNFCLLAANHCALTYTPPSNPPSTITITASYDGDSAHSGSSSTMTLSENPSQPNPPPSTNQTNQSQYGDSIKIPEWVRDDAKWWSNGSIDDTTFTHGLQYMIQHGIIIIPQTQSGSSTDVNIPQWIRNDAESWSNNQIDDTTFAGDIQYLIQNGIIMP